MPLSGLHILSRTTRTRWYNRGLLAVTGAMLINGSLLGVLATINTHAENQAKIQLAPMIINQHIEETFEEEPPPAPVPLPQPETPLDEPIHVNLDMPVIEPLTTPMPTPINDLSLNFNPLASLQIPMRTRRQPVVKQPKTLPKSQPKPAPRILTSDQVDHPPTARSNNPNPVYPARQRRLNVQGNVIVHLLIDEQGRVEKIVPISGPSGLLQSVLSTLPRWRFRPARHHGQPTRVWATKTFQFQLH